MRFTLVLASVILLSALVSAQDNYEIQVYRSDTVPPGSTMAIVG